MTGELAPEPDGFDAFAGFTGGVDQPVGEAFHASTNLFDSSGLALDFGPPSAGGDDLGGAAEHHVSWYDAPHHW